MVTSLLLGPSPMQHFCELRGHDGLMLAYAPKHSQRGIVVLSDATARSRALLHVDHTPPADTTTQIPGANVVVFADLLDRAHLKRAA